MWKKNSVTVIIIFFHIDPTFYSLNIECLWYNHIQPAISTRVEMTLGLFCATVFPTVRDFNQIHVEVVPLMVVKMYFYNVK